MIPYVFLVVLKKLSGLKTCLGYLLNMPILLSTPGDFESVELW